MRERGSGVLSDFLVTAPQSESLNQIAERVIMCNDVGNPAHMHAAHGECNNYILYAIRSRPMWQEKSFRTPDPLSAFREGLGTRLNLYSLVPRPPPF